MGWQAERLHPFIPSSLHSFIFPYAAGNCGRAGVSEGEGSARLTSYFPPSPPRSNGSAFTRSGTA
jgi:hypothetical protein